MRISKRCQYGLRAVFELALREPDRPVKTHKIASVQNIPVRFLETILNELKHEGYVESHRGNSGGYTLAMPPDKISINDIVQTLDGPICLADGDKTAKNKCEYYYGDYAFEKLWKKLEEAISGVCGETRFSDMVNWEQENKKNIAPDYSI